MLGLRETEIYGDQTLESINLELQEFAASYNYALICRQSNHEGELVDILQEAFLAGDFAGIIINAAAYTHTSIAIHDSLKLFKIPIIEVHLSDPQKREKFRHHSYITPLASKVFKGMGKQGYLLALKALINLDDDIGGEGG